MRRRADWEHRSLAVEDPDGTRSKEPRYQGPNCGNFPRYFARDLSRGRGSQGELASILCTSSNDGPGLLGFDLVGIATGNSSTQPTSESNHPRICNLSK